MDACVVIRNPSIEYDGSGHRVWADSGENETVGNATDETRYDTNHRIKDEEYADDSAAGTMEDPVRKIVSAAVCKTDDEGESAVLGSTWKVLRTCLNPFILVEGRVKHGI